MVADAVVFVAGAVIALLPDFQGRWFANRLGLECVKLEKDL